VENRCVVPVFCFMPDHLHVMFKGLGEGADALLAIRKFKLLSGLWFDRTRLVSSAARIPRPHDSGGGGLAESCYVHRAQPGPRGPRRGSVRLSPDRIHRMRSLGSDPPVGVVAPSEASRSDGMIRARR
jgi:hypothetical protein